MKRGLEYIKSFLKEIPQEELRAFSEYVYKHLSFFISHLPDEYEGEDLNKYFETMNAGGKGLENHEILKVELLRNADDQERKTRIWNKVSQMDKLMLWRSKDFSQDYLRNETFVHFSRKEITVDDSPSDNKQSQTILEIIDGIGNTIPEKPKQNEKESDDYAVVSFPEFLLLVLDLTVNADTDSENFSYDTSKLLETFDTKLISKKDNELVTEFYNNLYWYRLLLDLFVIRVQKSDESNNAREYELPFGSHNSLKQYQSMLYVSTTYHRWLKPFLKELKKRLENVQQMPSAEDLLAFLKQTDNALRDNNSIQPNNMTYGNIDRYWFWRLDYYLWEMNEKAGKKDEAISKYVFRANRSIEHLHPQNQSENDEWDKKHIDSFGNLAMISSGFNSTQSNDPVGVKFSRIKDQHDKRQLQSIKLWKMYELANGSDLHWTLKLTEKHQKEMLEILRNSFPPTTNS